MKSKLYTESPLKCEGRGWILISYVLMSVVLSLGTSDNSLKQATRVLSILSTAVLSS